MNLKIRKKTYIYHLIYNHSGKKNLKFIYAKERMKTAKLTDPSNKTPLNSERPCLSSHKLETLKLKTKQQGFFLLKGEAESEP